MREARSLFSPKYLERLESVSLPDPLPFTGIKLEKRSMLRYQSNFDVLELVRAASEELAESRPEEFKAFVLAVMAGLRRNEIDKLEWSRFNWTAERSTSRRPISSAPKARNRSAASGFLRRCWRSSEATTQKRPGRS